MHIVAWEALRSGAWPGVKQVGASRSFGLLYVGGWPL